MCTIKFGFTAISQFIRSDLIFTLEEEERFTTRYQNGYDLCHDVRYNEWLKIRHPKSLSNLTHDFSSHDIGNSSTVHDDSYYLNFAGSEEEPTDGIYMTL